MLGQWFIAYLVIKLSPTDVRGLPTAQPKTRPGWLLLHVHHSIYPCAQASPLNIAGTVGRNMKRFSSRLGNRSYGE